MRLSDGEIAQKVLNPGMFIKTLSSPGTFLAAKKGVRYYVHTIAMSARNDAATAVDTVYIQMTVDGLARTLIMNIIPNVINVQSMAMTLDVLTDVNTSITLVGNPSDNNGIITYQEVLENDA